MIKLQSLILSMWILSACSFIQRFYPKIVVTIDGENISVSDIELRDKVQRIYSPEDTRSFGELQLTKAFTYAAILKRWGQPISAADLETEASRIEQATLMPEKLREIKAIFSNDRHSYLRLYVLPVLVERRIYYDFFLRDPSIQQASRAVAESFLMMARNNPTDFLNLAKSSRGHTEFFSVSRSDGLIWDRELDQASRQNIETSGVPSSIASKAKESSPKEASRWIDDYFHKLKTGDVVNQVIDQGEGWVVVRYLGPDPKNKNKLRGVSVGFPKADFAVWLEAATKEIPVTR